MATGLVFRQPNNRAMSHISLSTIFSDEMDWDLNKQPRSEENMTYHIAQIKISCVIKVSIYDV